jgi:serine/threonine protein kinase
MIFNFLFILLFFSTSSVSYLITPTVIDIDNNFTGYNKFHQATVVVCNHTIILSSESQQQTSNRQIIVRLVFNDTLVGYPSYLSYNSSIYQDVYTAIPIHNCSFLLVMKRTITSNTEIFLQIVDLDLSNTPRLILKNSLSIDNSDLTKATPTIIKKENRFYMTWRSTLRPTNSTTYYQIKHLVFDISNTSEFSSPQQYNIDSPTPVRKENLMMAPFLNMSSYALWTQFNSVSDIVGLSIPSIDSINIDVPTRSIVGNSQTNRYRGSIIKVGDIWVIVWLSDQISLSIHGSIVSKNGIISNPVALTDPNTDMTPDYPIIKPLDDNSFILSWYNNDGISKGENFKIILVDPENNTFKPIVDRTPVTISETSGSKSITVLDPYNFYITWSFSRLNFMIKYKITEPVSPEPPTSPTSPTEPTSPTSPTSPTAPTPPTSPTPPEPNDLQSDLIPPLESSVDNTIMIVLIVTGVTCIFCIGIIIVVVYRSRERGGLVDEEYNLSPRIDKVRTILNGRFQSIDKISIQESDLLERQCGIPIFFPEGKKKIRYMAGEGNFSEVKLGFDLTTQRIVGIKKVTDPVKLIQCKYETWVQQQLHHKNVLELLDSNIMDNSQGNKTLYIFFDLFMMDCELLKSILTENKELNYLKDIMIETIFKGVVSGISYMHSNKFYHRDIKPSNILVGHNGEVKIIDFGCSCYIEDGWMDKACGDMTRFSPECFELMRGEVKMVPAEKVDSWAVGLAILDISTCKYPLGLVTIRELKEWDRSQFTDRITSHAVTNNQNYELHQNLIRGLLNVNCVERLSVADFEHLLMETQTYLDDDITRCFNTVQKVYHVRMVKYASINNSVSPTAVIDDYQDEAISSHHNPPVEGVNPNQNYQVEGIRSHHNPNQNYQVEGVNPNQNYQVEGVNPNQNYQVEGVNPNQNYQVEGVNPNKNYCLEGIDYSRIPEDYQV